MSDDDELTYVKKQKTIHYGSLEDAERIRQIVDGPDSDEEVETKKKVTESAQIHISSEYFALENEM